MQKHQRPVLLIPNRCNWSMILLCFIDQFNCRVFVTWWSWLLRLNCFSLNWIDSTLNFPFRSHVLTTLNIIVVQQHLMMLKVTLFLTSNKKHFQRDYCVRLHQLVHEFNLLNLPYHDLDRRTDGRLHFTMIRPQMVEKVSPCRSLAFLVLMPNYLLQWLKRFVVWFGLAASSGCSGLYPQTSSFLFFARGDSI